MKGPRVILSLWAARRGLDFVLKGSGYAVAKEASEDEREPDSEPWAWLAIFPNIGLALLWALAQELDELGGWWPDERSAATPTGARVCRACSGRGEVHAWGRQDFGQPGSDATGLPRNAPGLVITAKGVEVFGRFGLLEDRWKQAEFCACDGPTRPDTVSLAWMVKRLIDIGSPRCSTDVLPEIWQARLDEQLAAGDKSWQTTWWRCFIEWVSAGKVPDPDELAPHLRALTPKLLAEPMRSRYQLILGGEIIDLASFEFREDCFRWSIEAQIDVHTEARSEQLRDVLPRWVEEQVDIAVLVDRETSRWCVVERGVPCRAVAGVAPTLAERGRPAHSGSWLSRSIGPTS